MEKYLKLDFYFSVRVDNVPPSLALNDMKLGCTKKDKYPKISKTRLGLLWQTLV